MYNRSETIKNNQTNLYDDGTFKRPQKWYKCKTYTLKKNNDTWKRNMSEGRLEWLRLIKDTIAEEKETFKNSKRRKIYS